MHGAAGIKVESCSGYVSGRSNFACSGETDHNTESN